MEKTFLPCIKHLVKSKSFYNNNTPLEDIVKLYYFLNDYGCSLLHRSLLESDTHKLNYISLYKKTDSLKQRLIPVYISKSVENEMIVHNRYPMYYHCGHITYIDNINIMLIGPNKGKIIIGNESYPEKCPTCEKNGSTQTLENYVENNLILIKLCDVEPLTKDEKEYLPCLMSFNAIIDDLITLQLNT